MAHIYPDITSTIGNTPLVRLNRTAAWHGARAEILLKLEFFNPLSSVKDRIGLALIERAIASGRINAQTLLIEPTSGNTGIALAFVAAAKGLRLILTMPDTMSEERRKLLKILGAKVILSPGAEGMRGAIRIAEEMAAAVPNSIILQQFANTANPDAHRRTTAEEILRDTDSKLHAFVAGVGTGGTITGVGSRLREEIPGVRLVAVEPAGSPVLSGGAPGAHRLQGIGAGFVPPVLNRSLIDEVLTVKDEDAANVVRQVNALDGIPLGISSGATVHAALTLAKRPEFDGGRIVAMVASASERYLSTWVFRDVRAESDIMEELIEA